MRVLVTRPSPDAERSAERLCDLGHRPLVLPLTRLLGLPIEKIPGGKFDAVAATSANALRFCPPGLLSRLAGLPFFAVGGHTAGAAAEKGFAAVTEGPGGAEGLAALVCSRLPAGARLAFLCGRVRLPTFEAGLKAGKISVETIETYAVETHAVDDATVKAALRSLPPEAILFYSAEAARAYAALAARPALTPLFSGARLLCLSQRVAAVFPPGRAETASAPKESALFSLLGKP